jgi:hypothetical protein
MKRTLVILLLVIGGLAPSSRGNTGSRNAIGSCANTGSQDAIGSRANAGSLDATGSRPAEKDSLQPVRIGLNKIGGVKAVVWSRKLRFRFYNDLAGVSARLKLYPLAMKCYYNAVHMAGEADTSTLAMEEDEMGASGPTGLGARSEPIKIADLLAAFEDGKEAAFYAILAEVKQPVPGKRKAFTHINNVGHVFITLIKYNKDKSTVCRSFGFYPHKSTLFSATPLCPHSPSAVKDDAGHDWDEAAGKFISARRFRKIVGILRSYDHRPYDLNRNNCTDFGLAIARQGGIAIAQASGHWPLGKGNNPGSAGQSMLEGKVSNIDEEDTAPLFISTNLPAQR